MAACQPLRSCWTRCGSAAVSVKLAHLAVVTEVPWRASNFPELFVNTIEAPPAGSVSFLLSFFLSVLILPALVQPRQRATQLTHVGASSIPFGRDVFARATELQHHVSTRLRCTTAPMQAVIGLGKLFSPPPSLRCSRTSRPETETLAKPPPPGGREGVRHGDPSELGLHRAPQSVSPAEWPLQDGRGLLGGTCVRACHALLLLSIVPVTLCCRLHAQRTRKR